MKNNPKKTPHIGMKWDTGKLRWDLLPWDLVEQIVRVLTYGSNKYAPNNWQLVQDGRDRYYAALMRHLISWRKGESTDQESGISHLAHVGCNLVFLMHFERKREIEKIVKAILAKKPKRKANGKVKQRCL